MSPAQLSTAAFVESLGPVVDRSRGPVVVVNFFGRLFLSLSSQDPRVPCDLPPVDFSTGTDKRYKDWSREEVDRRIQHYERCVRALEALRAALLSKLRRGRAARPGGVNSLPVSTVPTVV
jgi:hypothetical protein